jgi:hypothetical protein
VLEPSDQLNEIFPIGTANKGYKYIPSEYPSIVEPIKVDKLPTGAHGYSRKVMDILNRLRDEVSEDWRSDQLRYGYSTASDPSISYF